MLAEGWLLRAHTGRCARTLHVCMSRKAAESETETQEGRSFSGGLTGCEKALAPLVFSSREQDSSAATNPACSPHQKQAPGLIASHLLRAPLSFARITQREC